MSARGPETKLVNKMRLAIKARGGWARKSHGGPQGAGWPDLVCVYRGHAVMVEVKVPGKERNLTKLQRLTLDDIKAAGGIALCLTTVDQVTRLLDRIDALYD